MIIPEMSDETKKLLGIFPFEPLQDECAKKEKPKEKSPIKVDENNTTGIQLLIVSCMGLIGLAIWLM